MLLVQLCTISLTCLKFKYTITSDGKSRIAQIPMPKRQRCIPLLSCDLVYNILSKAGINVCASQNEKVSFGPVMSSLGVRPLKKLLRPSFFAMLPTILNPLSRISKLRFCILVLITSSGADTMMEELDPQIDATKFCPHVAEL